GLSMEISATVPIRIPWSMTGAPATSPLTSSMVDEMRKVRGGCAPNIAYTLALLGERPRLMATAGCDAGDYRDWLVARGVDTSLLRIYDDCFTASFFVNTDLDQNQIASFYTGAMARARELSFHALHTEDVEIAIIAPNDPQAMRQYARECRELGIPYIYDPSQQVARVGGEELIEGLTGARILIVNEYEYGILRKKTGLSEAQIMERVPTIIVTKGERGSTIITTENETCGVQVFDIPPAKVPDALDPTGVGDAYRAGLIKGLVRGYPWPVTGRVASVAAAYVLEHPGPQPKPYTRERFTARYRENFGDTPELADLVAGGQ
ncbi:MAG: carbohydrate kinase family protein, partial [Chloroflexota bacterium]|nr:carbohydrate kinase family protein [Chloroflexota bacterium]